MLMATQEINDSLKWLVTLNRGEDMAYAWGMNEHNDDGSLVRSKSPCYRCRLLVPTTSRDQWVWEKA